MVPGAVVIELFLAVMLTVAGVSKLIDHVAFQQSLRAFHVPGPIVRPVSFALPIVELVTAFGLLLPVAVLESLITCLVLLSIFTIAIAVSLLRGHRPACRCFGQASNEPIGGRTLVRNGLFISLTIVGGVLERRSGPIGGLGWLTEFAPFEITVLGILAVFAVAIAGSVWTTSHLFRSYGAALDQGPLLEEETPTEGGLAIGTFAPSFLLQSSSGRLVSLQSLHTLGHPIVLTFGDTPCGRCHNLAPDLAQWQAKYADRLTIASIVAGEPLEVEELVRASGLQNVLLDGQEDIAGRFGIGIVPAMLFIGRDNRIESLTALGKDAVRALWWRQLVAANSRDGQPTQLHAVLAQAAAQ